MLKSAHFIRGAPVPPALNRMRMSTKGKSVDFTKKFRVTKSGWYHLRAEGAPADRYPLDTRYRQRAAEAGAAASSGGK